MSLLTITEWGTITITNAEALTDVSDVFYNVFGLYPNLYPSSPTGAFIQELADMEINAKNTASYITSNLYGLDTTNGIFLDGIGNLFKIYRNAATYASITCTVTGLNGITIPSGSQVSDGTNIFASDADITISTGGTTTGEFTCTTLGQVNIQANSVTTILSPITGWSTVTNTTSGTLGTNIQNDTAYRYTLKYSQAINGNSFVQSLYAILTKFVAQDGSTTTDAYGINVPYLQGFYIYSNYSNSSQVIVTGTTAIPVGGVYITIYAPQYLAVDNPDLDANLQYLAGIILNQIGANTTNNIQPTGDNNHQVMYANPTYPAIDDVQVNFDSPVATPIQFTFNITLYNKNQRNSTLITAVQNAILDQFYNGYTNGTTSYPPARMNQPINTADYIATIVNVAGACTINSQDIELVSGGTPGTSLTLTVDKIATLILSNINISLT